ncbi:HAD-like protein [Rhizodiscina lignyota]|uniref:HAD-like protein n=1 Tax=Rhizodiscina lignyota TaxID=1504668 RepID=A0A9P4IS98_9PEZI|nr:HAD-like protein [Rhizodiscina lignyota]
MTQVPPSKSPSHFKVCSFDVNGTLVDWVTGIRQALLSLEPIAALPDSHPLKTDAAYPFVAFKKQESSLVPLSKHLYSEVLSEVYTRLLEAENVPMSSFSAQEIERQGARFAEAVSKWPAFPDTVSAMNQLSKYYKLVALSNTDNVLKERTLAGALKGVPLAAYYTAQDIGSYKPDQRNFEYLIGYAEKELGAKKDEIWHVAQSLFHDHVPATKIGLETGVWVDRMGVLGNVSEEMKVGKYGWRVKNLAELTDIVEEAFKVEGK